MCRLDPVFFVNAFCWTYDPLRFPDYPARPMILWPHQENAYLRVLGAIGHHDVVTVKNRDEGATWCCLILPFLWRWRFFDGQSFLLVSRNADYVDTKGNPKSLFWKLDYVMQNWPEWLVPLDFSQRNHRTMGHLLNPERDSVIDGESTTGNVGKGDRRTAVGVDEFAAFAVDDGFKAIAGLASVSNCRIFNSTHIGTGTAFYAISQRENIETIRLVWTDNPYKNRGMYTADKGELRFIDTTYQWPLRDDGSIAYPFILDGKVRSPYYDEMCAQLIYPAIIASELDANPTESSFRWFPQDLVNTLLVKTVKPPVLTGHVCCSDKGRQKLGEDGKPLPVFKEAKLGSLALWERPNSDGRWAADRSFIVGGDISAGSGSSNSALPILDASTGEQVGEYVTATERPERLAVIAVALGWWFNEAYLNWECNNGGLGGAFGQKVIELGYSNFLRKRDENAIFAKPSSTIPGTWTTPGVIKKILTEVRDGVTSGELVIRSKEAIQDMEEFQFTPDGQVVHAKSINRIDPSGARKNHADRLTAIGMAWHALKDRPSAEVDDTPRHEIPIGSPAWLMSEKARMDNSWEYVN